MTREEALQHFETQYVKPLSRAKRLALEAYYQEHRADLIPEWVDSFRQICLKIEKLQRHSGKGKIQTIQYAMLRTTILEQSYLWRIDAYDKTWYQDELECSAGYDARWAFRFLAELAVELETSRKQYLNLITPVDVERFVLQEAEFCQAYVTNLARHSISVAVKLPEYRAIGRESVLEVRSGEYFDWSEVVYKEDPTLKDAMAVKRGLEAKREAEYIGEVLSGLDLSGGAYDGVDLRYARLVNCNLTESDLQCATLIGTQFTEGMLERANLREATIWEADFRGCTLRGACFSGAIGFVGWHGDETCLLPGFLPVDFSCADLEGADFENADIRGAIFTGARLLGVNFQGAKLQGAIFSSHNQGQLRLDEEQQAEVIWR